MDESIFPSTEADIIPVELIPFPKEWNYKRKWYIPCLLSFIYGEGWFRKRAFLSFSTVVLWASGDISYLPG